MNVFIPCVQVQHLKRMVYQATSLVVGLLSFNVPSLWVLYLTVSLVFLFKFKILNIHAIYKSSNSGELMACIFLKLI